MKNKAFILLTIILSISMSVYSQKQISGLITDKNGNGIPYSLVTELLANQDSLITTTMSDSLGRFSLRPSQQESFLYITNLGFKSKKIPLEKGASFIKIVLETDSVLLNEVTVTANKPTVKVMPDRIVCDLSSNPLKNDNMFEALKFVPLIQVTDESFSIIGKDQTVVYINGRKSNLSGDALKSYIRALPAGNVKNIEVITAPNSTFRGEGNFGIINIHLKSDEYEGIRGNFSGQIWRTHYVKERGSLNLDYQKNKLIANISVGVINSSDWKNNSVETVYKQSQLNTSTHTITDGDDLFFFANLSADYKLTDSQTIGFAVNSTFDKGHWTESGLTRFSRVNSHQIDSLLDIHYKSKSHNPEIAVNANYRAIFDNARQYLFVDFDYLNNYNKQKSENRMNYLDENENQLEVYQEYTQLSPQKAHIWSGKIEYGNNMESLFDLKGGIDSYYSTIGNDDKYQTREGNNLVIDASKSNNFEINEWTSAFFIHLNKTWNKKLTTSLGSRFEYTKYKGILHTSGEDFTNDYFKWLPSLYIAYTPTASHKLNYNLTYRISRPSFKSLNPFIIYTSPTSYSTGNPYLNPAKRISHNLQYLLLNRYYFIVSYNETKDIISKIQIVKENNWVESKPVNLNKDRELNFLFNTDFKYLKGKGVLNLDLSYTWGQTKGSTEGIDLDYNTKQFRLYLSNYYLISRRHDLSFDLSINYMTKRKYANLQVPSTLEFSIQLRKKIKNWQFSLYCYPHTYLYDSKWTQKWKLFYETDDLKQTTYKWGESLSVGLRISYNFGNTQVKGLKDRSTSNSNVRERVN